MRHAANIVGLECFRHEDRNGFVRSKALGGILRGQLLAHGFLRHSLRSIPPPGASLFGTLYAERACTAEPALSEVERCFADYFLPLSHNHPQKPSCQSSSRRAALWAKPAH
jgi:hypothetical protein